MFDRLARHRSKHRCDSIVCRLTILGMGLDTILHRRMCFLFDQEMAAPTRKPRCGTRVHRTLLVDGYQPGSMGAIVVRQCLNQFLQSGLVREVKGHSACHCPQEWGFLQSPVQCKRCLVLPALPSASPFYIWESRRNGEKVYALSIVTASMTESREEGDGLYSQAL